MQIAAETATSKSLLRYAPSGYSCLFRRSVYFPDGLIRRNIARVGLDASGNRVAATKALPKVNGGRCASVSGLRSRGTGHGRANLLHLEHRRPAAQRAWTHTSDRSNSRGSRSLCFRAAACRNSITVIWDDEFQLNLGFLPEPAFGQAWKGVQFIRACPGELNGLRLFGQV